MMQSHIVQEIADKQILYLLDERDGTSAQTQRIEPRRHILLERALVRRRAEDVQKRLRHGLSRYIATCDDRHEIVGIETSHPILNLFLVSIISGMDVKVERSDLWLRLPVLRPCHYIAIEHTDEIMWIHLCAVKGNAKIQLV